MLPIKRTLNSLISKAAQIAYPVNDQATIIEGQYLCDFTSSIASHIYHTYKKGEVSFGLFNPREIADGIFVNVNKHELIDKVTIGGQGEIEVTLSNRYLSNALNSVLSNEKVLISSEIPQKTYSILLTGPTLDEGLELFHVRELLLSESMKKCNELLGIPTSSQFLFRNTIKSRSSQDSKELNELSAAPQSFINSNLTDFIKNRFGLDFDFLCKRLKTNVTSIYASDLLQDKWLKSSENSDLIMNYFENKWVIDFINIAKTFAEGYKNIVYVVRQYEESYEILKIIKEINNKITENLATKRLGEVLSVDRRLNDQPIHIVLDFFIGASLNHIPKCYDPDELIMSAIKYSILKKPFEETVLLNLDTVLKKTNKSFFGPIAVYNHLEQKLEAGNFSQKNREIPLKDIENSIELRKLAIDLCLFPDAVFESSSNFSAQYLCDWLERTSEKYMLVDTYLDKDMNPGMQKIVHTFFTKAFEIIGIDAKSVLRKN
ncbi:argS [Blepharisma stoltei]|uniref:Arginine--tRNA ligase n=1 Tax=Blepharisma stoltei TaxID=1481888 RepID=A0AAU9IBA5_9CILI|nr:unnamed protein product [Blepharisma stoltei]